MFLKSHQALHDSSLWIRSDLGMLSHGAERLVRQRGQSALRLEWGGQRGIDNRRHSAPHEHRVAVGSSSSLTFAASGSATRTSWFAAS
jgi:hypothetical protein